MYLQSFVSFQPVGFNDIINWTFHFIFCCNRFISLFSFFSLKDKHNPAIYFVYLFTFVYRFVYCNRRWGIQMQFHWLLFVYWLRITAECSKYVSNAYFSFDVYLWGARRTFLFYQFVQYIRNVFQCYIRCIDWGAICNRFYRLPYFQTKNVCAERRHAHLVLCDDRRKKKCTNTLFALYPYE